MGGYQATLTDFEVPKKYGLRQTIADTIGIGGIFRGLRTIPVMVEMGERRGRALPARAAPELHEPDGDGAVGDLGGLGVPGVAHDRRVPQRARHASLPRRDRRRARGRHLVHHRGLQPPVLRLPVRGTAHGRGPLSPIARDRRRRPRGARAPRARRDLQAVRLLPHRDPASTRPSTCRGSCTTTTRSRSSAARSTSTSGGATTTSWSSPSCSASSTPARTSRSS